MMAPQTITSKKARLGLLIANFRSRAETAPGTTEGASPTDFFISVRCLLIVENDAEYLGTALVLSNSAAKVGFSLKSARRNSGRIQVKRRSTVGQPG
jgi:hypothetical protein